MHPVNIVYYRPCYAASVAFMPYSPTFDSPDSHPRLLSRWFVNGDSSR